MSTLHTISRSPASGLFDSCVAIARPGDGLLFVEDGAYYSVTAASIDNLQQGISVFVLKEDVLARGLQDKIIEHIEVIDYDKFVELCCEFDKVVSWF